LTSSVDDYFDDVISRLVALKRDARTGIERAIEAILEHFPVGLNRLGIPESAWF
jgi:hypothetical protein